MVGVVLGRFCFRVLRGRGWFVLFVYFLRRLISYCLGIFERVVSGVGRSVYRVIVITFVFCVLFAVRFFLFWSRCKDS